MIQNDRLETICNPSNLLYEVTRRCKWWSPRGQEGIGQEASSTRGNSCSESPFNSRQLDWTWIGRGLDTDARGVWFCSRPLIVLNWTVMYFLFNIYLVTDSWISVQKNGFVRDGIVDWILFLHWLWYSLGLHIYPVFLIFNPRNSGPIFVPFPPPALPSF